MAKMFKADQVNWKTQEAQRRAAAEYIARLRRERAHAKGWKKDEA